MDTLPSKELTRLRDEWASREGSSKGQYRMTHGKVGVLFAEIERLQLQVYALTNANKSLADHAAGQPPNRHTAPEPPADLSVQNAMAYLRTIELACDARDDRQSVTYIGEIRAAFHRLSRPAQPPVPALPPKKHPMPRPDEYILRIDGAQIQQLAGAVNDDDTVMVLRYYGDDRMEPGKHGEPMPAGLYAWYEELPEEGQLLLRPYSTSTKEVKP